MPSIASKHLLLSFALVKSLVVGKEGSAALRSRTSLNSILSAKSLLAAMFRSPVGAVQVIQLCAAFVYTVPVNVVLQQHSLVGFSSQLSPLNLKNLLIFKAKWN